MIASQIIFITAESQNLSEKPTYKKFQSFQFFKKNSTPEFFAAHYSNLAGTLTIKLQRSSRSRIFEFEIQLLRTYKSQRFLSKNSHLKIFQKL